MAKTKFLQIRLTPEDRDRIRRAAEASHLDVSTWARQKILDAVERWEDDHDISSASDPSSSDSSDQS